MFDIGNLMSLAMNTIFDIRDLIETGKEQPLNGSIITLQCVCTDDLPIDVRTSYCKSLEIMYAMIIRGLLSIQDRSRFNSSPSSILTSLPMLTPFDKVKFVDKVDGFVSVRDSLFLPNGRNVYGGQKALTVFSESLQETLDEMYHKRAQLGLEDVILKDAATAAPTFVEIGLNISHFGGKSIEKKFSIGIQVRPKVVSPQEMMQFLIRKNNALANTDGATRNFWQRAKNKFSLNYKRFKNTKVVDNKGEKTLDDMMNRVKGVQKPFVCLLMSNLVRDGLVDLGLDLLKNSAMVQKLYDSLPIMSIGIYDSNTDTITSSLTRDSYFITRTSAEFNSEISQYEKQLAEIVRVNRLG